MHADTDAIRAHAHTTTELGAELAAAAALLARDLGPTVATAFGPIGARFAQALAEATAGMVTDLTKISDELDASGAATAAAAGAYDDVEERAQARIARAGM